MDCLDLILIILSARGVCAFLTTFEKWSQV